MVKVRHWVKWVKYFFSLRNGQNSTPYLTPPHTTDNVTPQYGARNLQKKIRDS